MKKKFKALALLLLSSSVLVACESSSFTGGNNTTPAVSELEKQSQDILESQPFMDFNGMISQETVNYQEAKDNLMQTITDHQIKIQYQDEGRHVTSNIGQNQGLMELSMILKVKRENFMEAYNALQSIDKAILITSNLGSEDKEDEVDYQATELEEIEKEIAELEKQIEEEKDKDIRASLHQSLDQAKARRKELLDQQAATDNDLEWGTINYYLFERERIGNQENDDFSIGTQVGYSFNSFWIRTKRVFQWVIVFILNILPYLLVLLVLSLLWRYILGPVLRKIFPKRKDDQKVKVHPDQKNHPSYGLAPRKTKQAISDTESQSQPSQPPIKEETIYPKFEDEPESQDHDPK